MFNDTDRPEVKTEARNVMILNFGRDGRGDFVAAEGAQVPNEVSVYVNEKVVGRATLHTREDGIHADIMLEKGSLTGMNATAIAFVKSFEMEENQRTITAYEIRGVGLTPETSTNEPDEHTNTKQTQENK